MILGRRNDENDAPILFNVLQTFGDAGLGFSWTLAIQVAGWILQGIGLGKNVYDAIKGAGEQLPAGQKLDQQDVSTIADQLSKQYPTTSKSQWEQLINQTLADKVSGQLAPPPCPEGYTRDPISGACVEIKKPGLGIPTWGWAVIAGVGLLVLPRLGILR